MGFGYRVAEEVLRYHSYLCQQLEKQAVVDTTIAALSRATGVSWRHTQACAIFRLRLPLLLNAGRLVTGRFAQLLANKNQRPDDRTQQNEVVEFVFFLHESLQSRQQAAKDSISSRQEPLEILRPHIPAASHQSVNHTLNLFLLA